MFLWVKRGQCVGLTSPPSVSQLRIQCGIFNISQPCRPLRPVTGIALLFFTFTLVWRNFINICQHSLVTIKSGQQYWAVCVQDLHDVFLYTQLTHGVVALLESVDRMNVRRPWKHTVPAKAPLS
jgi:hypothetical protein